MNQATYDLTKEWVTGMIAAVIIIVSIGIFGLLLSLVWWMMP